MERIAIIPEGTYDGTTLGAWCEQTDKDEIIVAVEVQLEPSADAPEPVICRHPAFGEWAHLAEGVVKHLGLDWPKGLDQLQDAKNRPVRVRVKNKQMRNGDTEQRFYILTSERKKASQQTIAAAIAKFEAKAKADEDGEIPF